MKFRHRLLLTLILTALAGAGVVAAGTIWLVRWSVEESLTRRIRAETDMLGSWIERDGVGNPQSFAQAAARELGVRVTLIDSGGRVLGDSAKTAGGVLAMDNHLDRPEIVAASRLGTGQSFRRSATTDEQYFYCAARLAGESPVKFVRIALPARQVRQQQWNRTGFVLLILFAAMALLTVVAYLAVRRLSKPIEVMSRAAERVTRGELDIDVPVSGRNELSQLGLAVNQMKGALLAKVSELEAEHALLTSVLSGMQEGLLLVGPDRRIRLTNRAAVEILGARFDPTGHLLAEVVRHPTVLEEAEAALGGKSRTQDSVVRIPGSGRAFSMQIAPLDGGTAGIVILLFEITRLEKLEQVRHEFLSNVSHELRTPLTSIRAFVETLLASGADDQQNRVKFLEIIRRHTERMGALIEDITDLSLIETGAIELEIEPVVADELIRDVGEQLRPMALKNDVTLNVNVEPDLKIDADRRRLEQVLTNLVHNAIKFNRPGGSVTIHGRTVDGDVVVEVADTGIGIPEESLDKVFQRFYRVDPARSREAGGTGLGLAIVKHLMRLHRGSVHVESELGRGSRFELHFPPTSAAKANQRRAHGV